MTAAYETSVIEPAFADWSATKQSLADDRLAALRTAARRRLVDMSERYVQKLQQISVASGLTPSSEQLLRGDSDRLPIVMTGHQPVVFHSGLTFKYELTEQFASQQNAIGVAVVIDTDEGDAGAISFPNAVEGEKSGSLLTAHATFGESTTLYSGCKRKSASDIQAETSRVTDGLRSTGVSDVASRFQTFANQFAALSTDSIMEANLIVRWHAGIGGRMLELPLSAICKFPEVIQFFAEILARPFEFAQCYNDTLSSFRADQKIKNEANPFPSLQVSSDRCELPFWIVDTSANARSVVSIHKRGLERTIETSNVPVTELLPGNEGAVLFSMLISGQQLIPRGALITAMLRLLFSDLFVHGTGGGRYDRYTDTLIRQWWKVEPTPFSVASASRYLFPEERHKLLHGQRISEQLRDLQFNPQRHFGTGVFRSSFEDSLRQKVTEKDRHVERLRKARETGESARDIGREIQQIGDDIKSIVAAEFEPQLAILRETNDNTMATINNRLWPWMFF